jgi:hypothetical protein
VRRQNRQGWSVIVEAALGGRLASLRDPAGREWLWHNPDPAVVAARARVKPGDPFVDAGGWEECFPTIAGASDHGEIWSHSWMDEGGILSVAGEGYAFHRAIEATEQQLTVRYLLDAAPRFRFVWAAHLLLDLSPTARLEAAPGTPCRVWPDHWRAPEPIVPVEGPWPAPLGAPLDALVPDGTALFFMLLGTREVSVADERRLTLRLDAPGQPTAVGVWRNLGGWPPTVPYRSIGVEPAIGRHYDRDFARPDDLGAVSSSGHLEWALHLQVEAG